MYLRRRFGLVLRDSKAIRFHLGRACIERETSEVTCTVDPCKAHVIALMQRFTQRKDQAVQLTIKEIGLLASILRRLFGIFERVNRLQLPRSEDNEDGYRVKLRYHPTCLLRNLRF